MRRSYSTRKLAMSLSKHPAHSAASIVRAATPARAGRFNRIDPLGELVLKRVWTKACRIFDRTRCRHANETLQDTVSLRTSPGTRIPVLFCAPAAVNPSKWILCFQAWAYGHDMAIGYAWAGCRPRVRRRRGVRSEASACRNPNRWPYRANRQNDVALPHSTNSAISSVFPSGSAK